MNNENQYMWTADKHERNCDPRTFTLSIFFNGFYWIKDTFYNVI